jgi:hypothetical protein
MFEWYMSVSTWLLLAQTTGFNTGPSKRLSLTLKQSPTHENHESLPEEQRSTQQKGIQLVRLTEHQYETELLF